ncbi:50S ribosomal protein L27 [Candidatus Dependentiae bacterium]|nr:50S ribosomal protein L27 [Candidatus Dependentiae bacterium]
MATSKQGGSTQNGRESHSKRLGVKKFSGEVIKAGNILIRQRGSKFYPGTGVMRGSDDTLFAVADGYAKYYVGFKGRRFVSVVPERVN